MARRVRTPAYSCPNALRRPNAICDSVPGLGGPSGCERASRLAGTFRGGERSEVTLSRVSRVERGRGDMGPKRPPECCRSRRSWPSESPAEASPYDETSRLAAASWAMSRADSSVHLQELVNYLPVVIPLLHRRGTGAGPPRTSLGYTRARGETTGPGPGVVRASNDWRQSCASRRATTPGHLGMARVELYLQ